MKIQIESRKSVFHQRWVPFKLHWDHGWVEQRNFPTNLRKYSQPMSHLIAIKSYRANAIRLNVKVNVELVEWWAVIKLE